MTEARLGPDQERVGWQERLSWMRAGWIVLGVG